MKNVKITNEYEITNEEEKIISYLGEKEEIFFVRTHIFSFESKDTSNQFQLIDLANLEEKKMICSELTVYEKTKSARKYFLTDLGLKIAKQLS